MPLKEFERQTAVDRYVKTDIKLEAGLLAIAQMAATICAAPSALITLSHGDTQYVSYKISSDFTQKINKESSFHDFINAIDEFLIVEDTYLDPRFINNHMVICEPKIRFFAGVPLTTHDGHHLGTLCVTGQVPNSLSSVKLKMLKMLASQIIQLFEFESSLAVLKKQFIASKIMEVKVRSFFGSSTSEHIMVDKDYKVLAFNKRLMDFVQKVYAVKIEKGMKVTSFVHESYMEDFVANCKRALSGERVTHEREILFGNRSYWCDIIYDPAKNADGEIIGVSYNSTDITDRIMQQNVMLNQKAMLMRTAFLQSHELRKPVANIKGLLLLLKMDGYFDTCPALGEILNATDELDQKIQVIVSYTDI